MLSKQSGREKRICIAYMMPMCDIISDFIAQTLLFQGSGHLSAVLFMNYLYMIKAFINMMTFFFSFISMTKYKMFL